MLNNLTNYPDLIKLKAIVDVPQDTDLITLGVRNPNYDGKYRPALNTYRDFADSILAQVPTPPVDDTLVSFLKFSATEIMPGFPGTEISNLVEFKNDALITVSNVQGTGQAFPFGPVAGYSIKVNTTLPNADLYDWAIEIASVPALADFSNYTINVALYSTQNLTSGIVGNVNLYGPYSSLPMAYQMDNVTVRVTAKLKP